MGAYEKSTDVNQIAAVYRENPENAYRVCSMGIIYRCLLYTSDAADEL